MIGDSLREKIKEALKSGEETKVSTFRLLLSALNNEKIAKMRDLSKEEEIAVVKKQLKQREEAIEALRQAQGKLTSSSVANLEVRIGKEHEEAEILKEFLPEQMGVEEIEILVNKVIKEMGVATQVDFGKVMQKVMEKLQGRADGKIVAELVRGRLG